MIDSGSTSPNLGVWSLLSVGRFGWVWCAVGEEFEGNEPRMMA